MEPGASHPNSAGAILQQSMDGYRRKIRRAVDAGYTIGAGIRELEQTIVRTYLDALLRSSITLRTKPSDRPSLVEYSRKTPSRNRMRPAAFGSYPERPVLACGKAEDTILKERGGVLAAILREVRAIEAQKTTAGAYP